MKHPAGERDTRAAVVFQDVDLYRLDSKPSAFVIWLVATTLHKVRLAGKSVTAYVGPLLVLRPERLWGARSPVPPTATLEIFDAQQPPQVAQ